jgi:hypothetical protein
MATMVHQSGSNDTTTTDTTNRAFEHTPFGFPDNSVELCAEFDRIWQTPLEIERELRLEGYERVTARCLDDDCPGYLWVDSAGITCDRCGLYVRKDETYGTEDVFDRADPWREFFENRPRYRSGRRKCVGGLAHYEWPSNHDLDDSERIGTLDPEAFYR